MSTAEFGNVLDQQNQFLKQLALKLTKHLDDAEDLIQDTYFKALKNQDKYRAQLFRFDDQVYLRFLLILLMTQLHQHQAKYGW